MESHISKSAGHLHWEDYGGTGPTLVLVHGLGGSTVNWNAIGPKLANSYRTVAVDLPGFGLSPPAADWELTSHVSALASFISGIAPSATIVGNSLGGLLSIMVAADRPDLVEDLVLISPATPPRPDSAIHWPTARRVAIQATPGLGRLVSRRYIKKYDPEELVHLTLNTITDRAGHISQEMMSDFVEMARMRRMLPWAELAVPSTATSIAKLFLHPSKYVAIVRDVKAPTLVIHGMDDLLVSSASVEWLCGLRPDWDLVQLDNTGHIPQVDAPVRLLSVLEPWLSHRSQRRITA